MKRSLSFDVKIFAYHFNGRAFHNVVAEKIGSTYPEKIMLIGAHYDTVLNSPGADDNASGIAALLELVRLFNNVKTAQSIRFVAFTLEEPPHFGTAQMGSYVYAQECKKQQENIVMMASLEMLAYFSNKRNSQKYPHPDMTAKFTDKGNFITIVGDTNSKSIVKKLSSSMDKNSTVPALPMVADPSIPGVSLSDHAPFWDAGYKAIMITDTAFYRNHNYHESTDTLDTLDFKSYAKVVSGLYYSFKQLDAEGI